jgi:MYXO-CTERM domain-containing protein
MGSAVERRSRLAIVGTLALFVANAAPGPDQLRLNLDPLIDAAAPNPAQFAVEVPHRITLDTHGGWHDAGGYRVWNYELRVPSAVSLSFYAPVVHLPAGATLAISGGDVRAVHFAEEAAGGRLWSHIVPGDSISLELAVPAGFDMPLELSIERLQVGYRALAPGMIDHPRFQAFRQSLLPAEAQEQALAQAVPVSESCVENYMCHADAQNFDPSSATMGIVIGNMFSCTGTLLNDVPGSRTPYVLTARHCQSAGNPAAESRFYWDALASCGSSLPSVYSSYARSQFGAETLVEQEDAWLMRLNEPPVADSAAFAGWDATGSAFSGGFSVHHAAFRAQQYTRWFGTAVLAIHQGPGYSGRVWRTNNELGNVGFGASGGGLFDGAGRHVGVVSRALFAPGDNGGYGVCPVLPPVPATADDWAVEAVALGLIWNSIADVTSRTNPRTLRSVLDPQSSGQRTVDSVPRAPIVSFFVSTTFLTAGAPLTLSWDSTYAQTCTASGGGQGSGWGGALPPDGSQIITEAAGGTQTYVITCANGPSTTSRQAQVQWRDPPTIIGLRIDSGSPFVDTDVVFVWNSNVGDCVASGGRSGDGWAGDRPQAGSFTARSSAQGFAEYLLTCGTGSRQSTERLSFNWLFPSALIVPVNVADPLRIGQAVRMFQQMVGLSCAASGGTAGDGWAGPRQASGILNTNVTSTQAGAAVYVLECTAGPHASRQEVTINWTDAPPQASLTATPTRSMLASTPERTTWVRLDWRANVHPCRMAYTGPQSSPLGTIRDGPVDSTEDSRSLPGIYTYTVTCGSGADTASASVDVEWFWPPAELTLFVSYNADQPPIYQPDGAMLVWDSNVLPCVLTGGDPGDGWTGTHNFGRIGLLVRPSRPGTFVYGATCGPPGNQASRELTLQFDPAPAPVFLEFSAFPSSPSTNGDTRLHWNVKYATSCMASGGLAGDGWAGPRNPLGGHFSVRSLVPGIVTYRLECSNPVGSTFRDLAVEWTGPPIAVATLTATPPIVTVGQSFVLSWTSVRAAECTAFGGTPADGWAGNRPPSGQATIFVPTIGSYPYFLQCGNSNLELVVVEIRAPAPPTISFQVTPASIRLGDTAALSWNSSGAVSCQGDGGAPELSDGTSHWFGTKPISGSQAIRPGRVGSSEYALSCGNGHSLTRATTTIVVDDALAPIISMSASPTSIVVNTAFELRWQALSAVTCTASGGASGDGWAGPIDTQGLRNIRVPTTGTHVYGLDCTAPSGGRTQAQVSVSVRDVPVTPGGGGGGGGSSLGLVGLLGLLALAARREQQARRRPH